VSVISKHFVAYCDTYSAMDYNLVRGDDRAYQKLEKLQYGLLFSNILLLIIALANFSVCIWIRFDLDFWEWVLEINWYTYWHMTYVVMFAMVFHAFNNVLSAYGTFTQSRFLLLVSIIIRFLVWPITLAGLIVICVYGVEESTTLIAELDVIFKDLLNRWDTDPRASRIMVQIQEYVGCCGASGNSMDYINWRKPVPDSCRHPVNGNRYGYHCPQVLAWWLEPWTCTLAGISLLFCILDPVVVGVTMRLRSYIKLTK